MTLLDEIQQKCSAELIASRDFDAIAAAVSVGRTKLNKVPIADVQAHLQSDGSWWSIKAVAGNADHPAQGAAIAILDVASARYENIDTTLPIVGQMLGGLVAASVIQQASMDTIVGMGVTPDPVTAQQVSDARGGV